MNEKTNFNTNFSLNISFNHLSNCLPKYFKTELEKDTVINENTTKNKGKNEENNLINITYESIDREGKKYIITAETGNFVEDEPDLIYMTNVNAKIILLDGSIIYINSLKAEYNSSSYDTKFNLKCRAKVFRTYYFFPKS